MNIRKLFFVIVVLVTSSCRKNDSYLLRYTKNMDGPHVWTGTVIASSGDIYPYTRDWPISYINDSTLRFWSPAFDTVTYHYWTSNAGDQTISFTAENFQVNGVSRDTLIYHYSQNVIYYNDNSLYNGPGTAYHLHSP